MITRRQLLGRGAALAAGGLLLPRFPGAAVAARPRLPKFTVPLPIPRAAVPVAPGHYRLTMHSISHQFHPSLGEATVWSYDDGLGAAYLGPTIVATRGTPLRVEYVNQLPTRHLLPVDPAITEGLGLRVR